MSARVRLGRRGPLLAALSVLTLAAGSTLAVAAAGGAFGGTATASAPATGATGAFGGRATASPPATGAGSPVASSCTVPSLPGSVVDVRLVDAGAMGSGMGGGMMGGGMMGGGMMGGGMMGGGMMGGAGRSQSYPAGMMRLADLPSSVHHGAVSFRVTNAGWRTHEMVVLPLAAGQQVGERAVGSDGTVSEAGSRGEASASCAAGEGDGITAGSTGWVTLHLPAGRYELVCNLPGHYAAGMYAELDVS